MAKPSFTQVLSLFPHLQILPIRAIDSIVFLDIQPIGFLWRKSLLNNSSQIINITPRACFRPKKTSQLPRYGFRVCALCPSDLIWSLVFLSLVLLYFYILFGFQNCSELEKGKGSYSDHSETWLLRTRAGRESISSSRVVSDLWAEERTALWASEACLATGLSL